MANKSKVLISLSATVFLSVLFFLPADKTEAAVTPGYYSTFSSISDNFECKKGDLTPKRICNLVSFA